MKSNAKRVALTLEEGGVYRLRSTSRTVCYVDLDQLRFYRERGPGSPVFPYDFRWVPLVAVTGVNGVPGVIRVGERAEYLTDPAGGAHAHRWYVPQVCVAIESVDVADVPTDRCVEE